jgi:hypothetical protein
MAFKKKFPPITDISVRNTPKIGQEITIEFTGYLSDSGWKLKSETVSVNEEDRFVKIKIPATRNTRLLATQVITYFTKEIKVILNSVGKWSIQCNNKIVDIELEE